MQNFAATCDLSIIVPTYNARELATRSAQSLQAFLDGLGTRYEIVLVDDGSHSEDRPDPEQLPPTARLIQLDTNRGKGYAVRTGLLSARGACRIFTDVDLPYGMDSLLASYRIIAGGEADFVHGDRSLPASAPVAHPSWRRRLSSAVFRFAVSSIVGLEPTDTQCGLKGFSGEVADLLASTLRTDHFAFDVEIFRFARDSGLRVQPIPVRLVNEDVSTVRLLRDSLTMVGDLLTIRRRARSGHYRQQLSAVRSAGAPVDTLRAGFADRS
jgi:dolichyl-phosphate beta-glucosyltransferase